MRAAAATKKQWVCPHIDCGTSFETQESLRSHLAAHSRNNGKAPDISRIELADVRKALRAGNSLHKIAKSMRVVHGALSGFIRDNRDALADLMRYKCPKCDYRALGGQGLAVHARIEHGMKAGSIKNVKATTKAAETKAGKPAKRRPGRPPLNTKAGLDKAAALHFAVPKTNQGDAMADKLGVIVGELVEEIAAYDRELANLKLLGPDIEKKRAALKVLQGLAHRS
jgi:hypothetical protein